MSQFRLTCEFNFILVSTVNESDNGIYYRIKGNKIESALKRKAQGWVKNYQKSGGKRHILDTTLTPADRIAKCFETKHLWFCKQKVAELKKEIDNQLKKDKNAGIKIKLVSYTDESFIDGAFGGKIPQNYKQRLTIEFVFTDKDGREVYIDDETINTRKLITLINNGSYFFNKDAIWKKLLVLPFTQKKWTKILELLNKDEYSKIRERLNNLYTMDTGVPAPPPSGTDNMAALDFEP